MVKYTSSFINNIIPANVNFESIPELTYKKDFLGPTDYIDNIKPSDLTYPVMRGKDIYNRLYVVVHYKNNVQTYFQRYTNDDTLWTYGQYIGGKYKDCIVKECGNLLLQPHNMKSIKEIISLLIH